MIRKLFPLLALAALLLAACGGSSPGASPEPLQSATEAPAKPAEVVSAEGQNLFVLNCGECHGEDGTGTDEAPAVLGHTAEQVKQQVRDPVGEMEAIPPDKLSDAQLTLIAEFVVGLGGEEAHPAIEPTEEERLHLRAAYEAIEHYEEMDRQAASTHLEQALALASGEAGELYEEIMGAIEAKKAGNARHELKELLGLEEAH